MNKNPQQTTLLMHLSLLCALLLTLLPWPSQLTIWQPHWLALLIAYWSLYTDDSRVMYVAFAYGLLLDVLMGSLLGKHGMSLVALSFLVTKSAKQLRMTSFWQLLIMVLVWLFNDIVIRAAIDWISFRYQPELLDLLPLLTAAVIWPWLKYLMDRCQTSLRTS
ncbi:rod shape-determining protein MreD [Marinicella meishanensis]|uniref:rod shape-determining protein MreD n=1 Tax=Marinicella meishanensis TaxID=2873263 RepID=UPI001CBF1E64|nr:rod shape-determining protein MreD [Marinicella sp. NBU2979]